MEQVSTHNYAGMLSVLANMITLQGWYVTVELSEEGRSHD